MFKILFCTVFHVYSIQLETYPIIILIYIKVFYFVRNYINIKLTGQKVFAQK